MSDNPSKFPKRILTGMILIVVFYLLYMATLQPLVAPLILPPIEHSGVDYYEENRFLRFHGGNEFDAAISSIPFCKEGDVSAFVHYDTFLLDNLFYGPMCDAFILDLSTGQHYEKVKEYVIQNSGYCYLEDNCEMHWIPNAVSTDAHCFLVAFSDSTKMVRCILLVEYENHESFAESAWSILLRYFGIHWEAGLIG